MTESTSAETAGFFSSPFPIPPIGDKTLQSLSDQLLNSAGTTPLHSRFRALFTLKSICIPPFTSLVSSSIVSTIAAGFSSDRTSALLRHELAYVLGQIGSPLAIPVLEQVLCDVQGQEEMVRHEAAEALAAIGSISSIPLLQKFATEPGRGGKDDGRVVRETCEIALAKIQWNQSDEAKKAQVEGELLDRYGVFVNYFKYLSKALCIVSDHGSPLSRFLDSLHPSILHHH
jgi:deoxyhypusine monooxygenase